MKPYIPNINDQVLFINEKLYLPDNKIIDLCEKIFLLNKKYKIEKIVSFSNKDYLNELREILSNKELELYNHYIEETTSYFHITFEKEIIPESEFNYDSFCPYAVSFVIKGDINRDKYIHLFEERVIKKI